jgi:hypothetical protein
MIVEQLRQLHTARPFRPLEIHLADGRTLTVAHPEMLVQSQTGRTIGVAHPDDTIETIDLSLVTKIKPLANGSSVRGRRRS